MTQEFTLASARRIKADLTLLLVSLIWGSAFVAQRVAATHMDIYLFNGMRFILGALVLLPLEWRTGRLNDARRSLDRRTLLGVILAGMVLFIGASLQTLGMRFTTAGNAGFITGLYVVFVPILLAVGWRQWPRPAVLAATGLAAVGMFLLSTGGHLRLAPGDGLEFIGAVLWAFHVILVSLLVRRGPVLRIAIGQNLVCGLLSLMVISAISQGDVWQGWAAAWWTVVYTGVLSIGVGYTLQLVGQKETSPSDAAIILSAEAVFAALFGWLLLDESLTGVQILGCVLMVAAMLMAQLPSQWVNSSKG
ncbi:MAG TPA: DMT family transporter [Anaerolineales bacterium]|nr:DMT family transporter [Anaerolineales bacterium]